MADPIPKPPQWASASRDDRGRKIRIYRAGFMGLRRWTDHPVPKDEWERIRWANVPVKLLRPKWRSDWIGVFICLLLIYQAFTYSGGGHWLRPIALGISAAALLACHVLGMRGWIVRDWVLMVESMLSHKRCAQCAYPIGDLSAAEDGRVVCPECGAVWFAASIGKPMQTISNRAAD